LQHHRHKLFLNNYFLASNFAPKCFIIFKNEGEEVKTVSKFFIEVLNIRGVGSQIGMGILNKFSICELINAINTQNKKLICSVPGVGLKMSERLILELKSKFKNELEFEDEKSKAEFQIKNDTVNKIVDDLQLTLKSLNYTKNEIKSILPIIIKETDSLTKKEKKASFENLLKLAMNYLDNVSSNIDR